MKAYSLIIKSVFLAGLLAASGVSFAMPISGSFGMMGQFTPLDSSGVASLDAATKIHFTLNEFRAIGTSGTFLDEGLDGSSGDIKDLQFDPFTPPVDNFWTLGDFSFDLTTLVQEDPDNPSLLSLSGTGLIKYTGIKDIENTRGSWTFYGTSGGSQFNWLGESEAGGASVPEPMVLALIGIGLVGFGGVRGFRGRRAPGKK